MDMGGYGWMWVGVVCCDLGVTEVAILDGRGSKKSKITKSKPCVLQCFGEKPAPKLEF